MNDLTELDCSFNQLTSLDVSKNTLMILSCQSNLLTSLDVTQIPLWYLSCQSNLLTSLDVSQNTDLVKLECYDNELTSLDVRNGNNSLMTTFSATGNASLACIEVDNASWSTTNWTNVDVWTSFSENCGI
jgi:Leucine-rich repeat (LRR) protein